MVAAEFLAGLGSFKTMLDMAKGLKDISDATVRNAAVIDLQERILAAQAQQTALIETVGELEKQVASFEAWDAEKKRYDLTDFGGGTFAYVLKQEEANGEPSHRICANCYQQGNKSILQSQGIVASGREHTTCPACETVAMLGVRG